MMASDYSIVDYIENHGPVSLDALAEECQVRERTARSYIKRVNVSLDGAARITWNRSQGGYILGVQDAVAFKAWKDRQAEVSATPLETPQGRIACLMEDLLQRDGWITLDELSEAYYISRTSISTDLREVERRIGAYGLSLARRPHYGIRVEGPEMARRLCLAAAAMDASGGDGVRNLLDGHLDKAMLETISQTVNEVTRREDYQINSLAYQNLLVHIAVALVRIQEGDYVPMETSQLEEIQGTHAWEVAVSIAEAIGRAFSCELPDEEIAYIAIHLAGKRLFTADPDHDGDGIITEEVWNLVSEMLEIVYHAYRFDFRDDLELRMNLARHIVPLSVRLEYHLAVSNPILEDTKARFPLAYAMAISASDVLTKRYGSRLSDDELGYIALAFALALDHKRTDQPKKRVLAVCASGRGSAKLLEYRFRREFGPYLESVEVCDAAQVASQDFSKIDYVVTTVPLGCSVPVPVCEIQYFMDVSDIERVRGALETESDADPARYLDQGLFFPHLMLSSKKEVISFLCGEARMLEGVDEDLEQQVWDREAAGPTAFGNQVALPHPLHPASDRTRVAIGLLDTPITWDDREVRAVFLLLMPRDDHDALGAFYEALAAIFIDSAAIRTLLDSQTFETMCALLRRNKEEDFHA